MQTSAHDVRVEAESLRDSRVQALALRRQESAADVNGALLDEKDMEVSVTELYGFARVHTSVQELRLYTTGLDSATKAARTIITFLTQRSLSPSG